MRLNLRVGENVPQKVMSDEAKVSQIVINLVVNALKHSKGSGVIVDVS